VLHNHVTIASRAKSLSKTDPRWAFSNSGDRRQEPMPGCKLRT